MLKREGFVSNSSTTSFCIVGDKIDRKDISGNSSCVAIINSGWEGKTDIIFVTEENKDIMKRLRNVLFVQFSHFGRDGDSIKAVKMDHPVNIYYGSAANYKTVWTTDDIEDSYLVRLLDEE